MKIALDRSRLYLPYGFLDREAGLRMIISFYFNVDGIRALPFEFADFQ